MRFIFLITFLFPISSSFSQANTSVPDTTKKVSPEVTKDSFGKSKRTTHSPKTAVILSAIITGLGQAYNKKYWKIPIVYAAMGTTIYFVDYNNKLYKEYKRSYISKT